MAGVFYWRSGAGRRREGGVPIGFHGFRAPSANCTRGYNNHSLRSGAGHDAARLVEMLESVMADIGFLSRVARAMADMSCMRRTGMICVSAWLGLAVGSSGDVVVVGSAWGELRFLEVREITSGSPAGQTGLNQHNNGHGGFFTNFDPIKNLQSTGIFGGGTIGDPGAHAPPPGSGWRVTHKLDTVAALWGSGLADSAHEMAVTFVNVTGGSSIYEIDCEIEAAIGIAADHTASGEMSRAIGMLNVFSREGHTLTSLAEKYLTVQGPNGSDEYVSGVIPFTLTVGEAGGGHGNFAEVRFEFEFANFLHAVPAPGAGAPLFALLAVRRRRTAPPRERGRR